MFKFFIKYVMQHTLFKESDSAKTSEQADNLILTTILSALRRRLTPTAYILEIYPIPLNKSLPCLSEKSAGA